MKRVVVDTNVRFSALIYLGNPLALLNILHPPRFLPLISEPLLEELRATLLRKSKWEPTRIESELERIEEECDHVRPTIRLNICRDPDDDRILECALAGHADFIVTGDKDLLVLDPFRGIRIVTLRQFLDLLSR
jgi:putative PIN family toxin of toxin-antitoxin system